MFCTNCGRPVALADAPCAHCNGNDPARDNATPSEHAVGVATGIPNAMAFGANTLPVRQAPTKPERSSIDKTMFTMTVLGVMGVRPLLGLVAAFYLFVLLGYICDGIVFVVKWLFGKGR